MGWILPFDKAELNNIIADHHAWLADNTKGKQAVFGDIDGGDYFDHYNSYCFYGNDLVGVDLRNAIIHPCLLGFSDDLDLTSTNLKNVDFSKFIIQNSYIGRKLVFAGIDVTTYNTYMIMAIENGTARIEVGYNEADIFKRITNYNLLKEILSLGVTSFLDLTQAQQDDIKLRYTLDSLRIINHAVLTSDLNNVLANGFVLSSSGRDALYINSTIDDIKNNFDSTDIVTLLEIVMPVHNYVYRKDNEEDGQYYVNKSIPASSIKVISKDLFAENDIESLFTDNVFGW